MRNRLKQIREKKLLTLRDLAVLTGYGVSTINNFENGKTAASSELLKKLASCLETNESDILADPEQPSDLKPARVKLGEGPAQITCPGWLEHLAARLSFLETGERDRILRAFHISLDLHLRDPKSLILSPIPDPILRKPIPLVSSSAERTEGDQAKKPDVKAGRHSQGLPNAIDPKAAASRHAKPSTELNSISAPPSNSAH